MLSRRGTALAAGAVVTVPAGVGVAWAAPAEAAGSVAPGLAGTPTGAATPAAMAPTAAPAAPAVVPAAAPAKVVVLRYGSTGTLVKVLQGRLRVSVDGRFGPRTLTAVRAYQRAHHLRVDGVVGPATWASLGGFPGSRVTPPPQPRCTTMQVVRWGWSGTVVRALQGRLNIPVDGSFGLRTLNAVRNYQRMRGLLVDGVVGPATWAKLGGFPCGTTGRGPATGPLGSPGAPYRMPYPAGITYRISQGPGGQTSHHTIYNKNAIDIAMPSGSAVSAVSSGTVFRAGWTTYGAGNQVMIRDAFGRCSVYSHLSGFEVRAGQRVARGQVIARSGATGAVTGAHLHFDLISCSSLRSIATLNTYEQGRLYPAGTYVVSRN